MRYAFLLVSLLGSFALMMGCGSVDGQPRYADDDNGETKEGERQMVDDTVGGYLEKRLVSSEFGGTIGCAYEEAGEEWDGDRGNWYGWVFCLEVLEDGSDGTGISLPVALRLERKDEGIQVTGHETPEDGSGYEESFRRLFPDSVRDRLTRENIDLDRLEREARKRADS
ncbi:hypothetical protein [Desmospora profundinema]|uniref:Lipoprotein n=1 Tax=Desmospora profundinema TaxID=1571184 RepID=A0ABU1IUT4_9BACL|nr:hypothetical protein [Desmospora profundinema]MDR6227639.1 hypothetical protein [Desmospora profundinema]